MIKIQNSACLVKIFKYIDKGFSTGDHELEELISVSFLENLSYGEKSFESIGEMLSKPLKKELSLYYLNEQSDQRK